MELRLEGTAGVWSTWVELIHYCELALGRSETPQEQLATQSPPDLHWLAKDLLGQVVMQREREHRK